MANRKPIPHINVPIMQANGSMELAWYLFLQWVSENAGAADLSDYFTKEETQALLDAKANIDDLADVAFSGSYNDLSNKPTIGNATITIKQGGVAKGSFTVNQTGDEEIDIDQGGSDIDNLTITKNTDDEMQAVAVIDQNTGIVKTWTGTAAEYEAIVTKDPDTEYIIVDDIGDSATAIGQITEALNDKVDKGHEVIEFQAPIAANNYTWYKKYADGWVEQGGYIGSLSTNLTVVNLPVEMADNKYYRNVAPKTSTNTGTASNQGAARAAGCWESATTTSFTFDVQVNQGEAVWEVKGMAA